MNEPIFKQSSPADCLDYPFDWTAWLATGDDAIASYVVHVPPGVTKVAETRAGAVVIPWLRVARPGYRYRIGCTITTTSSPPRTCTKHITIDAS